MGSFIPFLIVNGLPGSCGPQESWFYVVENEEKELVQTRLPTKVHVCIDYRKLNAAIRKDHFPLPFIDQMLERLVGLICGLSQDVRGLMI